jgi:hypothetical protein
MLTLRRKKANRSSDGRTKQRPSHGFEDYTGSDQELLTEIEQLTDSNRAERSYQTERRLVRLRHLAGLRELQTANGGSADFATPDATNLAASDTLPEFTAAQLTPELMRAAILRDGCVLVRGLIDRDIALRFGEHINGAFDERLRREGGESVGEGYYEVCATHPTYDESLESVRPWVKHGGGLLAADSPPLCFQMIEMFRGAGVPELIRGYLGETPLISVHKTTLRKADPEVGGGWHQDGAFMGAVHSINLWLSLSRCGDEAPGLDVVPRRLDDYVRTGSDETFLEYQVSQRTAEEAAGDKQIIRPIFEPGDALFFDELFLHKTGSDPSMPNSRYAIENWFFGASAYPAEYAPLLV